MLDPQAVVFRRLRDDAALAGMLDTYGAQAAIFAAPVPNDLSITSAPALYVDEAEAGPDQDTYTEEYRAIEVRVRLYCKPDAESGGMQRIKAAADRARRVLKDWPAGDIAGGRLVSAAVTGPVAAPTDDPTLAGRLLFVRILMQEIEDG